MLDCHTLPPLLLECAEVRRVADRIWLHPAWHATSVSNAAGLEGLHSRGEGCVVRVCRSGQLRDPHTMSHSLFLSRLEDCEGNAVCFLGVLQLKLMEKATWHEHARNGLSVAQHGFASSADAEEVTSGDALSES